MVSAPSDAVILGFWSWFEGVAGRLNEDLDEPGLLEALDARVSELGEVVWELGPGSRETNALAISPDGAVEWLAVTQRIVAMAPTLPGWEFHPARQARPSTLLRFSVTNPAGRLDIDASDWRYVLVRFADATFDLVLEQSSLLDASEADRYTAAVILLDGLVGEATRLLRIREIECMIALRPDVVSRSNPVSVLADHLASLDGSTDVE